jgi:hypothetical protein
MKGYAMKAEDPVMAFGGNNRISYYFMGAVILPVNLDKVGFSPEETNDFLIEYDNGNVVQDNDKYSRAVANFIKGIAENHTDLNATLGLLGNSDYDCPN